MQEINLRLQSGSQASQCSWASVRACWAARSAFIFQRGEERLCGRVVPTHPGPANTGTHLVFLAIKGKFAGGVLGGFNPSSSAIHCARAARVVSTLPPCSRARHPDRPGSFPAPGRSAAAAKTVERGCLVLGTEVPAPPDDAVFCATEDEAERGSGSARSAWDRVVHSRSSLRLAPLSHAPAHGPAPSS
jgi:hypothetical protein